MRSENASCAPGARDHMNLHSHICRDAADVQASCEIGIREAWTAQGGPPDAQGLIYSPGPPRPVEVSLLGRSHGVSEYCGLVFSCVRSGVDPQLPKGLASEEGAYASMRIHAPVNGPDIDGLLLRMGEHRASLKFCRQRLAGPVPALGYSDTKPSEC